VASLAGIALDRGLIDGTEQRLTSIIPDLVPKRADPRVNQITLADLLTMRAGLERTSGQNYGRWVESDNWVAHVLSRPFVAAPGARMLYSTGSYHLLGVALARAGSADLRTLTRRWLGDPLDIEIPPWTRDPQGHFMGGNNMALAPLGLHRFGEMWRKGGYFAGQQVLSRNWIGQSWQPRTRSSFSGDSYGYGWFLDSGAGQSFAYARGYGGQMLYIVPSLAMTVTVTSDPTRPARSHGYAGALKSLLVDRLIPAAMQA
jgi:CubicO group peptidase (beta-lactamase class C family)